MISVVHITPHLGGGVGRVLLNHLAYASARTDERHRIITLEDANLPARERAAKFGIPLEERMASRTPELLERVGDADVVVIHWWNHPLLYSFMFCEELPPARLLIWSHVNGHFPTQNFTDELIAYPDLFAVATTYSLETPAIRRLTQEERGNRVRLVFSCAGLEHVAGVEPVVHEGFQVGYVGTVDYCKMHPRFIYMSAAAQIPDARFVVCGGPNEDSIRNEAIRAGVSGRFEFLGHVDDIAPILARFDVFGYPLASVHYGTGEQALIEALSCGIPPVVLANGSECHIVQDGVTGIVAKDEKEYSRGLELLYRQPEKRLWLGLNARHAARRRFAIEHLAHAWSELYAEAMQLPKRRRKWSNRTYERHALGAHIFLASLGEHGTDYAASMNDTKKRSRSDADERIAQGGELFRSRTRGSTFHYQRYYPADPYLNYWCGLILQSEGHVDEARKFFQRGR